MSDAALDMAVVTGDITCLTVDAIVNAANEELAGGGGVDGAIHRAAGHSLLQAVCRRLGGCPTGQVRVTPGFNLPARYIIHAVGPVWHGGGRGEERLLRSCYREAMAAAEDLSIASIAFPAISCGVYGYPADNAVVCAVEEVAGHLLRRRGGGQSPLQVIFCCFDQHMSDRYLQQLRDLA